MGKDQWDIAGYHDNVTPIFSLYGVLHCQAGDARFLAHINAMQAVVDAAKAARDTTKGHFIDLVGADAIFAALAKLEAK